MSTERHTWDARPSLSMLGTKEADSLLQAHWDEKEEEEQEEDNDNPINRAFLYRRSRHVLRHLLQWTPFRGARYHQLPTLSHSLPRGRPWVRRLWLGIALIPILTVIVILMTGIFLPSYTHEPTHYQELRRRTLQDDLSGRANIYNEKVFIATSLYDHNGGLVAGAWGRAVLKLVQILGPENVFVSIYENDPDEIAKAGLDSFAKLLTCNSSVVADHLDTQQLPHAMLPSGEQRVKRIAFLAEVRNQALRPLDDSSSPASSIKYDKLLFLNDVVFDPIDAANLLLSTNAGDDGRTRYRAACATDFVNPFKYYDTFATRDLEGYSLGVPVYPFFSTAGLAYSRYDVLAQKDAVRVRSCWGGMVAFDATWFQSDKSHRTAVVKAGAADALGTDTTHAEIGELQSDSSGQNLSPPPETGDSAADAAYSPQNDANLNWHWANSNVDVWTTSTKAESDTKSKNDGNLNWALATSSDLSGRSTDDQSYSGVLPLRFRSETDLFWESSECCLIHADLQQSRQINSSEPSGIYMNPYIRVAYDSTTLKWLAFARRFERVFEPFQRMLSWMACLPGYNPRRLEEHGDLVTDDVWMWDELDKLDHLQTGTRNRTGAYREVQRIAQPGAFCGGRKMLVLEEAGANGGTWVHFNPPEPIPGQ